MKLFELFKPERKNIVIKSLGCAAEQPLKSRFVAYRTTRMNGNGSPDMTTGLTFEAQARISDEQIERTSVRPSVYRFVAFCAATFLKSEQHGADESHERALARFIRSMKYIQSGING